jgi:hypothetical protein
MTVHCQPKGLGEGGVGETAMELERVEEGSQELFGIQDLEGETSKKRGILIDGWHTICNG